MREQRQSERSYRYRDQDQRQYNRPRQGWGEDRWNQEHEHQQGRGWQGNREYQGEERGPYRPMDQGEEWGSPHDQGYEHSGQGYALGRAQPYRQSGGYDQEAGGGEQYSPEGYTPGGGTYSRRPRQQQRGGYWEQQHQYQEREPYRERYEGGEPYGAQGGQAYSRQDYDEDRARRGQGRQGQGGYSSQRQGGGWHPLREEEERGMNDYYGAEEGYEYPGQPGFRQGAEGQSGPYDRRPEYREEGSGSHQGYSNRQSGRGQWRNWEEDRWREQPSSQSRGWGSQSSQGYYHDDRQAYEEWLREHPRGNPETEGERQLEGLQPQNRRSAQPRSQRQYDTGRERYSGRESGRPARTQMRSASRGQSSARSRKQPR